MGDENEFDQQGLVSIFVAEALDGLSVLWKVLHPEDGGIPDPESVHAQYIVAHTLKGASSLYGFSAVADLAGILEVLVENLKQVSAEEWPALVKALRELLVTLRAQIETIKERGTENPACCADWKARFSHLLPVQKSPAVLSGPARQSEFQDEPLTDDYLNPDLDPEVLSYFAPEAQEYLDAMEAALLRLEKNPDHADTIQQLFRTAHTLKGSAYTVGFKSIGDIVHHVEDFMGAVRENRMKVTTELVDVLFRVIDVIKLLMRRDSRSLEHTRREFATTMRRLALLEQGESTDEGARAALDTSSSVEATSLLRAQIHNTQEKDRRQPEDQRREGEVRVIEESSVIRVSRERLERLLNLVGELVISRGRLEQRLLALEQLSNQVSMIKDRMLEAVRSFEEKHAFTMPTVHQVQAAGSASELQAIMDFGGLEFDRYDDFNILARRMAEVSADIGESMSQLSASIRNAREDMSQLQRLTLGMRDEIARARMVPIGTPFTRFRRAVREIAKATGKDVMLAISGEHTEVDTSVVERLVDPLIHLVRNAVYHGIEPPSVRIAQGKPATGTIYLHAAHRGNAVIVEVEDDGGGIDVEKIKARAVTLGLVRPEQISAMSDQEAINLIFLPGFSTAEEVGDQAGRGVGMDVVKGAVEAINGQIEVETELGVGTKFTLRLPLTLLISTALMVRVGTERYALLLPNIREVVVPPPGAIQNIGGHPILQVQDEAVEIHSLGHLLGVESVANSDQAPIVIIRIATGIAGVAVDELLGRQEIVIKALGTLQPFQDSCFVGATIDPEGHVILVLDIGRLIGGRRLEDKTALSLQTQTQPEKGEATSAESQREEGGTRILLIDDSLSVRKFVGRMLQGAGYIVETAVDGEEGLRKALEGAYQLVITDLEMPKLNGYEVIQALRDRPQTRTIPILVMTTRAGEKHRQLALSIGASGYIAKPVEERALILEVGQRIGQAAEVSQ